jgi:UDP-N-acetylglucosamine 1-carboxyvinyltransferase
MKNTLKITGGMPLKGSIKVQGAKNEALQILAAVLLYPGKTVVDNIPDILDVRELINILQILGVRIEKQNQNSYLFDAVNVDPEQMKTVEFRKASSKLRGSLMIAGAMLGRFGVAYMPTPGGDKIGIRSVSPHLKAFQDLGAVDSVEDGVYKIILGNTSLSEGQTIQLAEASVTGTANLLLASVFYRKSYVIPQFQIYDAACEPYIQKLCQLLISFGAKIEGVGSNLLKITPVCFDDLDTSETRYHTMSPDMIELGSFISLAAVCGNGISIECPDAKNVLGVTADRVFQKLGVKYQEKENSLWVPEHSLYEIQKPSTPGKTMRSIYNKPWPGLSPDHMSNLIVLATHARGSVVFHEKMYENRLHWVNTLQNMGAEIVVTDKMAIVAGNGRSSKLRGIEMSSPDIRAGMALLIAALAAEGTSIIHNASQIHRGYENIVERLRGLGAQIEELD